MRGCLSVCLSVCPSHFQSTDIFTDAVTVKLYADDVKIYSSIIVNEKVIGQELQHNLN